MSVRAAWERVTLAWTIVILIAYLATVLVVELSCGVWLFLRSIYRSMGVQRYGS